MQGCWTDAPEPFAKVLWWDIKRCPRATHTPAMDTIRELHDTGYLKSLSPTDRMRAPAKLIESLRWAEQAVVEHRESLKPKGEH